MILASTTREPISKYFGSFGQRRESRTVRIVYSLINIGSYTYIQETQDHYLTLYGSIWKVTPDAGTPDADEIQRVLTPVP